MEQRSTKNIKPIKITLLVFAITITAVLLLFSFIRQGALNTVAVRQLGQVDYLTGFVQRRMDTYNTFMIGIGGLYKASVDVSREEWKEYISAIDISHNYPGVSSIGYLQVVKNVEKTQYTQRVRNDKSVIATGYPKFQIYPESNKAEYAVITFIEPYATRESALGFDVLSEPERAEAIIQARDTGLAVASSKVTTINTKVPVFFLYLPIYNNNEPLETVSQRRSAIKGYIMLSFLIDPLFQSIKDELNPQQSTLGFAIYEDNTTDADALLFATDGMADKLTTNNPSKEIQVADKAWKIYFDIDNDHPLDTTTNRALGIILFIGILFCILTSGLAYALLNSSNRAFSIAERMTQQLRESEQRAQFALEASHSGAWDWDLIKDEIHYTAQALKALGVTTTQLGANREGFLVRIHPEDLDSVKSTLDKVKEELIDQLEMEYRFKTDEGSYRWIRTHGQYVHDQSIQATKLVGTHSDIHNHKVAEVNLVKRTKELEEMNALMVGREMRMRELKQQLTKINTNEPEDSK